MSTDRDEHGRFTPQQTDTAVREAVKAREPAGTSEVAEELGVSRQAATYRLGQLEDAGLVERKKIGAVLVWYLPDAESGDSRPSTPEHGPEDGQDETPRETPAEPAQTIDEQAVEEAIAGLYLGTNDEEELEARREAVRAMYEHLQGERRAKKSDFESVVNLEGTGYANFGSFWSSCIHQQQPLRELPGVGKQNGEYILASSV